MSPNWGYLARALTVGAAFALLAWSLHTCSSNVDEAGRRTQDRKAAGVAWCRNQEHDFKQQCLRDGQTLTSCRLDWNWIAPEGCK